MNPTVLELAKLDFNMVQAVYQDDLKYASRYEFNGGKKHVGKSSALLAIVWWRTLCGALLKFVRIYAMITTIDNLFDVYGTLEELEQSPTFWYLNAIKELPDYMKTCFFALYNAVNEMTCNILTRDGVFVLPYLKKAVIFQSYNHFSCKSVKKP
ncbi:putative lyase [Helianthus anomalus]